MLWEEYYEKINEWATSTAVSRMSKLESFGPPDEIIDAINIIAFDDEKGATRLLKKAISAGVKFSGDQLAELCLICDEEVLNRAIQFSSDRFTTEDLDALYCNCDDEILIRIAQKQKIQLPEDLIEEEEPEDEEVMEPEEYCEEEVTLSAQELSAEYDYLLDCLNAAHVHLVQAYKLSIPDISSKNRALTVTKYACLAEAQPHIANALDAWELLEPRYREKIPLQDIRLNIGNSTMWKNYFFDGFFTNLFVKRRIYKVTTNIENAIRVIRKLQSEL